MLKYVNTGVVFQEIPDEVTLAVNISNCPCRCPGCHSKYLWTDTGNPLTEDTIDQFVAQFGNDITCIAFMGGDREPVAVNALARHIHKNYPRLKVAWYSGRTIISPEINQTDFDYIKVGPYIAHLGSLKEKTTNQRIYKKNGNNQFTDITSTFWKK